MTGQSTDEDDDPGRLFRENDNLGSPSNVLLRPIRRLLARGAPPGPMTALTLPIPGAGSYPFGVLTWTAKNRLVFWPILPKLADMAGVVDHITLELPSQRSHLTAYTAGGQPRGLLVGASVLLNLVVPDGGPTRPDAKHSLGSLGRRLAIALTAAGGLGCGCGHRARSFRCEGSRFHRGGDAQPNNGSATKFARWSVIKCGGGEIGGIDGAQIAVQKIFAVAELRANRWFFHKSLSIKRFDSVAQLAAGDLLALHSQRNLLCDSWLRKPQIRFDAFQDRCKIGSLRPLHIGV